MNEPVDFAIVGGGASGLYTAWRLAHATAAEVAAIRARIGGSGPLTIAVYEHSHRLGGRILSVSPPALPDVAMELGGMRYLSNQPLVSGLVEKVLNLETFEQVVDQPGNLAYFRGKRMRQDALCGPDANLPYTLRPAELAVLKDPRTSSPAELIFWAVYQEFPELRPPEPETAPPAKPFDMKHFLHHKAEIDGRPLYHWGFWNLLSRHLSNEGRQLAITAIGYDVLGANANAVDIIAENFDFTPDTRYYLFTGGYEAVFWRLAEQLCAAGGQVHLDHTLDGFDTGPDGVNVLSFHGRPDVAARAVVLALPQSALLRLSRTGPLFRPENRRMQMLLNSVSAIPLYKLFLVYDHAWWTRADVSAGRTLTDLPVRQCYYWHTDPAGPSAIMAYNDLDSSSFWGGYQKGRLAPGNARQQDAERVMQAVGRGDAALRRLNWDMHDAPPDMVAEMHRELMEIHGIPDAPAPIEAAYLDWMNAPFGGAVHFWNPGYKSWEVTQEIVQPVADANAFIVGEAYSTNQTWVEGAFETAEILLQGRLGMARPAWIGAKA